MAQVEFDLTHGLKIGNTTHTRVVLTEPTVADLLECSEESERPVLTSEGPALVTSPTRMGALMLCRQIKSIGGIDVPFTIDMLKKFEPEDMLLLQTKAAELDDATVKALEGIKARGRSGSDSG